MTATALLELLVVLVAAKLAAELAERARVPAVLGEIAAGMLLGPSALALVKGGEFLHVVGEIGVILLLLEVGMEMDLRELARVGRASLVVAVAGMALPFLSAWGALTLLDRGGSTAVFLGAALTATSVGITARAFGDLRALASVEARVVIGAAVADDVLGLMVLTVVVPMVSGDGVGGLKVLSVIGVALGFLVVTTAVGLVVAPRAVGIVQRRAVSAGAMVTLAFALTLAYAELAEAAALAPIVGAFVAGLSLGRSRLSDRIGTELAPLGHLFIPVFFFLIGTQADLGAFADPTVLGLAAVMSVVAIVGKVAAGWGATGVDADRLLVGIAMVPRGEVGLIFATIGKSAGVLDDQMYTALLMVVLVTTVVTPPLLRWRHAAVRRRSTGLLDRVRDRPDGGWLTVDDDRLVLRCSPDPSCALEVALDAARFATQADPGPNLFEWFADTSAEPLVWTSAATDGLVQLLGGSSSRSWRLLDAAGVFDRAAPELAAAMARRRSDLGVLDVSRLHDWPTLDRLADLVDEDGHDRQARQQFALIRRPDLLRLAAFLVDVSANAATADGDAADVLLGRLRLPDADRSTVVDAMRDGPMLRSAALHVDGLDGPHVLALVDHFGAVERARVAYLVALSTGEATDVQRERIDALLREVERGIDAHRPDATDDRPVVERRRAEALAMVATPIGSYRIRTAPAVLVRGSTPERLAATTALMEDVPPPGFVTVDVAEVPMEGGEWEVAVVARDVPGLLARVAAGVSLAGVEVVGASAVTWPDGVALDTFVVRSSARPDANTLAGAIRSSMRGRLTSTGLPGAEVEFDDVASPWTTWCTITGADRAGALGAIAAAFALNGINIHTATIETVGGRVHDRFALTDRRGRKLGPALQERVRANVGGGVVGRRARAGR